MVGGIRDSVRKGADVSEGRPDGLGGRKLERVLGISVAVWARHGLEQRHGRSQLQVIRVADSLGEVYFEDFVAQSLKLEEILRFFFQSNQRLQRFLTYLQLDWNQLLPHSDFHRSQLLSMLRELMEWAAFGTCAGCD